MQALNLQNFDFSVQLVNEIQEPLHSIPSASPGNGFRALPIENKAFGDAGGEALA